MPCRPLARRVVQRGEIQAATQLDRHLELVGAHESHELPELIRRCLGCLASATCQLPHIQLDSGEVLLDKRPFGVRAKQVGDPVAGAEPDFGLSRGMAAAI